MIKIHISDQYYTAVALRYLADRKPEATAETWNDFDPGSTVETWVDNTLYDPPETVYILAIGPNDERREWVCHRRVAYDAEAV
jgi:hypothetical protein